ncbi:MAG: hypothetical protein JO216_03960 [Hyphomicrobiales bacterium]|nr:hypothetical protein [Hyphomicrobiales bacterium]
MRVRIWVPAFAKSKAPGGLFSSGRKVGVYPLDMPFFRKPGTGQAEFSRYANFFGAGQKSRAKRTPILWFRSFHASMPKPAGKNGHRQLLAKSLNLATKVRVGGVWKSRRLYNEHEMQMTEQVR